VAMDAQRFVPVLDALGDAQAAIIEPATVAFHALRRTPFAIGSTVLVQGCGPIGLLCLQLARAAGAGKVLAVDPVATRRELALRTGADLAATPAEARAALDDLGAGRGADLVFECAGVAPAIQSAAELCRRGGTVGLVGYASSAATILPQTFLHGEITLVASLAYLHDEFATVQHLIADGRLDVTALHDATRPLSEAPEVFAELVADPTSAVKVLIDPRA
jgi:(R,R)-butanediol dehydrogenase / meso-butanediol dehydrogenase / diacetyl reductase